MSTETTIPKAPRAKKAAAAKKTSSQKKATPKKVEAKRKEVTREAAPAVIGAVEEKVREKKEVPVIAPANLAAKRRKDPKSRHFDASPIWNHLSKRDPNRHYVWAYKGCKDTGSEYYRSIGYKVETYQRNGVRPMAVSEADVERYKGADIEMRGCVLVSCDAKTHANIQEFGAEGNSGMEMVRARLRQIDEGEGADPQKYDTRYFKVLNETEYAS